MTHVLLVIHLLVTLVMIGLILLQRSEGGGLGIGGGSGGMGGLASPRSTANILTKATTVCFALFVGLSLILAIMAGHRTSSSGLIDKLDAAPAAVVAPAQPADATAEKPAVDAVPAEKPAEAAVEKTAEPTADALVKSEEPAKKQEKSDAKLPE